MHRSFLAVSAALIGVGCASTGYSGEAIVTGGILGLSAMTPTVDECADNVRTATRIPDPSSLGQFTQSDSISLGDGTIGLCTGPDGRTYFITPTEIRPGPTIMFEG